MSSHFATRSTSRRAAGIAGAGVIGRVLALRLAALGWHVTLFDRSTETGAGSASFAAAAMLAPYCELDTAESVVFRLGIASLELWPSFLREFDLDVFFQKEGSLVVAHPYDLSELERFRRTVVAKIGERDFRDLAATGLSVLEPELDRRFLNGIYFPFEGQIDGRSLLLALATALRKRSVDLRLGRQVDAIRPHEIVSDGETFRFDVAVDCRGYGAKPDLANLRAVRGELIRLHAPDVRIRRPVRLAHPRYPLYIVPRPRDEYLIGATAIESEDSSPLSLRSALELLSAAYTLNSAFSEARILETVVGLRPAFPSNAPRITIEPGLLRINGLFRHGYLITPKLAELAIGWLANGKTDPEYREVFT